MPSEIQTTPRERLTPYSGQVLYNPSAQVITGLEPAFNREPKLRVVVRTEGLREQWFLCKNAFDAVDIMKKYHAGEFTKLEWYTGNAQ